MIEFILGRKALYACHRDEALRRLTLVEQGAEQEQTPRGDPHTTRPGREGSAPVSQHIFHCKHGTSASAPIPRVVTWKRGVCLHSDESNASRVDCAGIPNEMAMTVWPLPTMKIRRLSRHVFSATYTYFRKNPIPFSNTCLPRQPREMPNEPNPEFGHSAPPPDSTLRQA